MSTLKPKDKAEELFNHFYENKFDGPGFLGTKEAKGQAVFVVDEIMDALNVPQWDGNPESSPEGLGDALYWNEVKKHIQNIKELDYSKE